MEFTILENIDMQKLDNFVGSHIKYIPTPTPVRFSFNMITKFYSNTDELENKLFKVVVSDLKKNLTLILLENKNPVGLISLEYLPWDSKHFKLKIGHFKYMIFNKGIGINNIRLLFEKIILIARKDGYKLIYANIAFPNYDIIHVLGNVGALLTGVSLALCQKPKITNYDLNRSIKFRVGKKKDISAIQKLVSKSFLNNRFFNDPYLPKKKCSQLYELWAKNSFFGFSDGVVVAEQNNGKIQGFYTIKKKIIADLEIGVHLDLLASANKIKGLGTALTHHFLDGCSKYDLVTAEADSSNIVALNLYEKSGFRNIGSEAKFHIWIDKISIPN